MNVLRRRHQIEQLLRKRGAATQEQLVLALEKKGFHVTQATVSRDLAAISAVKSTGGYRLVDDLSGTKASTDGDLARALGGHAVEITPAASLVIVRTAPGHAGVVGDALDSAGIKEALGTIAGDDTIFIATASATAATRFAKKLNALVDSGWGSP